MKIIKNNTVFLKGIKSIDDINNTFSAIDLEQLGICIAGRSNVGKSSLINALFGNNVAKVSQTPGSTREINMFHVFADILKDKPIVLFDLPGYGYASVSGHEQNSWQQLFKNFFMALPPKFIVINIQDSRNPNQNNDQEFLEYLNEFDHTKILVINKIDKLKNQKEKAELDKKIKALQEDGNQFVSIQLVSATNKIGIVELEKKLLSLLNS